MCGRVNSGVERQFSSEMITEFLGQGQTKKGLYLRKMLLIETNGFYSKDLGIAKTYKRNDAGISILVKKLKEAKNQKTEIDNVVGIIAERDRIAADEEYVRQQAIDILIERFKDDLDLLRKGKLPYVIKSDRYWNPIQNIPNKYKKEILANYGFQYSYDVNCCAPTVILQSAQMYGLDEYLFQASAYVKDKASMRAELVKDTGLDEDTIKRILTALYSGGKLGKNDLFALTALLNFDYEIIEKLNAHPIIQGLKQDISKIWKKIGEVALTRTRKDYLQKDGSIKNRLVPIRSKQKWGFYFATENIILRCVIVYLTDRGIPGFFSHDGFETPVPIDVLELQDFIAENTGYRITYSYEFLEATNPVPFILSEKKQVTEPALQINLLQDTGFEQFIQFPESITITLPTYEYIKSDKDEYEYPHLISGVNNNCFDLVSFINHGLNSIYLDIENDEFIIDKFIDHSIIDYDNNFSTEIDSMTDEEYYTFIEEQTLEYIEENNDELTSEEYFEWIEFYLPEYILDIIRNIKTNRTSLSCTAYGYTSSFEVLNKDTRSDIQHCRSDSTQENFYITT